MVDSLTFLGKRRLNRRFILETTTGDNSNLPARASRKGEPSARQLLKDCALFLAVTARHLRILEATTARPLPKTSMINGSCIAISLLALWNSCEAAGNGALRGLKRNQITPGELRGHTLENGNQSEFPAPAPWKSNFPI
jgi:hypothetical protein